jgi:hypothetical protein
MQSDSFARALLAILAVLILGTALQAQQTTGQIVGSVTDESGAVVPNAQITVSNPDTGLAVTGRSNSSGNYSIAALPPAQYEVKVEASGFGTAVRKNVRLEVGKVLTLNTALKAGATTQVVEVTGEVPLIETTRSDLGGSVSTTEVKALPLQTRNFANLSVVVPGVRPAQNFDPTKTKVGNVSLNGGDGRQFDVNVDGGDNKTMSSADSYRTEMGPEYPHYYLEDFLAPEGRVSNRSGATTTFTRALAEFPFLSVAVRVTTCVPRDRARVSTCGPCPRVPSRSEVHVKLVAGSMPSSGS